MVTLDEEILKATLRSLSTMMTKNMIILAEKTDLKRTIAIVNKSNYNLLRPLNIDI